MDGVKTQRFLALSDVAIGNVDVFHINLKGCNHLQLMRSILPFRRDWSRNNLHV